jgi:hypothetical protein
MMLTSTLRFDALHGGAAWNAPIKAHDLWNSVCFSDGNEIRIGKVQAMLKELD